MPSSTNCDACPFRTNDRYHRFTEEEAEFVRKFKSGELNIQGGATLFEEDADSPHFYTVLSGWAFRYKMLADARRQILNFVMPGDLVGLQAAMFSKLDHSVEALSDLTLCVFEREHIWDLYQSHPTLAFDITWLSSREERLLDEYLLNVGQRSARERIAHLLLLLFDRAGTVGLASRNRVKLPITQNHLADALGLSLVHTNKTLRKLVKDGFVKWHTGGDLELVDAKGLARMSSYSVDHPKPRPFI
jgi:CRP-like cAMP-binding protein